MAKTRAPVPPRIADLEARTQRHDILDAVPANVALLDRKGRIVFVNRFWREFGAANGYVADAAIGSDYVAVCRQARGEDAGVARRVATALAAILEGRRREFEIEYPCHSPDEQRWFRCLAAPIGAKARGGAVVMHFDVTARRVAEQERELLEVERRQASKMEALGTFAGGIAHDFNNLLLGMAGLLDMSIAELPEHNPVGRRLRSVRSAVEQAGALVRQILAFARRDLPRRERFDLAEVVGRALDLVAIGLPREVTLERRVEPVGEVIGDPVQLQQVVLNLAANAADAIGGRKGNIRVSLARAPVRQAREGVVRAPHARLLIEDDGAGIAPEMIERIFEPFFTTKDIGKGIGMGLAVVHGIVNGHGGHIEAESRPGEGSKFTVWVPLAPVARHLEPGRSGTK